MSYSVAAILVLLVKFVSSKECLGCNAYDNLIESFNDKAVTDWVLAESGSISKLFDCVIMCSRDIRCRSYRHNVLTETCYTYGVGYSLPEKTFNTVTAEAGSRLYAMCGMSNTFASHCSVDANCDFANSACSSGSCSCNIGYSYDVWTGDCLVRCPRYGNWFTLYHYSGVIGCNNKLILGLTPDGCKQACSDHDSFVCINVEYVKNGNSSGCLLCDKAWYDLDPRQREDGTNMDFDLYYRHCAY